MRLDVPSVASSPGKRKLDPSPRKCGAPDSEFTGLHFQQPGTRHLPSLIVPIAVATVGGS